MITLWFSNGWGVQFVGKRCEQRGHSFCTFSKLGGAAAFRTPIAVYAFQHLRDILAWAGSMQGTREQFRGINTVCQELGTCGLAASCTNFSASASPTGIRILSSERYDF